MTTTALHCCTVLARWGEPVLEFLTTRFDSKLTRAELVRGVGLYCTNAASLAALPGRALLPTFSLLSHSCTSNCR